MSEYRIKTVKYYGSVQFCLQKKSFLGFWYNPDNINEMITGWYDTFEKAEESYKRKITPSQVTYTYLPK